MKHQDIQPGMVLKLKKDRAEAYGLPVGTTITVRNIATRGHYKTPWIYSVDGAFKPSDFSGIATWRVTVPTVLEQKLFGTPITYVVE